MTPRYKLPHNLQGAPAPTLPATSLKDGWLLLLWLLSYFINSTTSSGSSTNSNSINITSSATRSTSSTTRSTNYTTTSSRG